MLSLVTIVADRSEHLARLLRAARAATPPPDEVVVVDMASAVPPDVGPDHGPGPGPRVVTVGIERVEGLLPLAAARNVGAATATGDQLVFLDVDCIPAADLFAAYAGAIGRGGLVCGPVRYLERSWAAGLDPSPSEGVLAARSSPHPVRPRPTHEHLAGDHERFWSLSFGLDRKTWDRIGGFDEAYVGYGAEDTDFALRARSRGVPLRWTTEGTAFHQWHRSESPPVGHLRAIVANARTFHSTWGCWPMGGWLSAFAARELVAWDPDGDRLELLDGEGRTAPAQRVLSIPASHPYARKVLPPEVEADPDPTEPWWPHRAFDLDWLVPRLGALDAVHVHFGFDHLAPDDLARWTAALAAAGVPLVVTVHDLHSPHEADPAHHLERLRHLLDAAAAVLTLTDGAAAALAELGRPGAVVVPHPHVGPREPVLRPARVGRPRVGVHLKAGRANLLQPASVLAPLAELAAAGACDVVLRVDDHAPAPLRADLAAHAADLGLAVRVGPRLDDGELLDHLDGLDVSVLPYAFGTHSGWLELCRDRGVRVVAPEVGCYAEQWDDVERFAVRGTSADGASLAAALRRALARPLPDPTDVHVWRTAQLEAVHEAHRRTYRSLADRGRA